MRSGVYAYAGLNGGVPDGTPVTPDMQRFGLTKLQYRCFVFLRDFIRSHGFAPSFVEITVAMNLKSKSGAHRLLDALEERGAIRRDKKRARAIEICDRLHTCSKCGHIDQVHA